MDAGKDKDAERSEKRVKAADGKAVPAAATKAAGDDAKEKSSTATLKANHSPSAWAREMSSKDGTRALSGCRLGENEF